MGTIARKPRKVIVRSRRAMDMLGEAAFAWSIVLSRAGRGIGRLVATPVESLVAALPALELDSPSTHLHHRWTPPPEGGFAHLKEESLLRYLGVAAYYAVPWLEIFLYAFATILMMTLLFFVLILYIRGGRLPTAGEDVPVKHP